MTKDCHGSYLRNMQSKKEINESIMRMAYNIGYAKPYSLRALGLRLRLRWLFRHDSARVYLPLDQNEIKVEYRKRWGSYVCSIFSKTVPQKYKTIVMKQTSHHKLVTDDEREFKIYLYIQFREYRDYVRKMGYEGMLKFRRDQISISEACAIILKKVNKESEEIWHDLRPIVVLRSGKVYELPKRGEIGMSMLVDDPKKLFLSLTGMDLSDDEEAVEAALVMALMS
ncbi:hypothetical protein [Thermicanus aegyptius]|uniref:hypothetical protein n=1 Tax=Thermicanus aegyptius TaxID=94009 RepID=UPI0004127274|nr:hypothetical protein [Thermicanus aegyptius]